MLEDRHNKALVGEQVLMVGWGGGGRSALCPGQEQTAIEGITKK